MSQNTTENGRIKKMSNKNIEDKLVSIWRHKKTGEYIIALMAGIMERLTYKKFIDKNNSEWIFFNPLATTCKSGEIESKSMGGDFNSDMNKLETFRDEIEDFREEFIRNNGNIDEYGTNRSIDTAFTQLWKVGNINNENDISETYVNKDMDFLTTKGKTMQYRLFLFHCKRLTIEFGNIKYGQTK